MTFVSSEMLFASLHCKNFVDARDIESDVNDRATDGHRSCSGIKSKSFVQFNLRHSSLMAQCLDFVRLYLLSRLDFTPEEAA
jgi:hypothetical protein